MKKNLLVKIIITIVIIAGLGCLTYKNHISKEKDLVFDAKIKAITVNDNIYYVLVERFDKK